MNTTSVDQSQSETNSANTIIESPEMRATPRLSHKALTTMLILMCVVPIVTIFSMWAFLPGVAEGKLEAEFAAEGLPSQAYYEIDYRERPEFSGGELIVRNLSDQDWTHLNLNINGRYQIYDNVPIPAHEEKRYDIDRFVSRSGARFSLRYNELKSARIYARRPTKDRATFECQFENGVMVKEESTEN